MMLAVQELIAENVFPLWNTFLTFNENLTAFRKVYPKHLLRLAPRKALRFIACVTCGCIHLIYLYAIFLYYTRFLGRKCFSTGPDL